MQAIVMGFSCVFVAIHKTFCFHVRKTPAIFHCHFSAAILFSLPVGYEEVSTAVNIIIGEISFNIRSQFYCP